jgi:hypothetical protein
MSVSGVTGQVSVNATVGGTVDAGANTLGRTFSDKITYSASFAAGTGAAKFSKEGSGHRTLAATSENIDLTTTLVGPDGAAVDFTTTGIKLLAIYNRETTTGKKLTVGGAAANAWVGTAAPNDGPFVDPTDKVTIHPGECRTFCSPVEAGGFGVSATSKVLKVDAGANTVSYDIIAAG